MLYKYNFLKGNAIFWISITLGLITMVLGAVRAPIFGLFIAFILYSWYENKKTTVIIVVTLFLLIPIAVEILNPLIYQATAGGGSAYVESPFQRLVGAFGVFDSDLLYDTTLRRSIFLFQDYFFINPFLGSGIGYIFSEYSYTDAMLMVFILEFGIIGLLLLLVPYYICIVKLKLFANKNLYKISFILLLVLLSQSIVVEGLWAWFGNIQFFVFIVILHRIGVEKEYFVKLQLVNRNKILTQ